MRYLALFKIKNSDFDYTQYGLSDVYFSIDLATSIQSSKGVKTTQYALLDGTTRIDTISRAPGTLTFQGNIGELFAAKSMERAVKGVGTKSRLELQVELLESLRDNAIVLDVITETKTHRNYIITSVNAGIAKFGISDINLSMKELLTFGDEIEITDDDREKLYSDAEIEDEVFVEDTSIQVLDTFSINNFTSDAELIDEAVNVIKNSDLTLPYIIQFGSSHTSPDIQSKSYVMTSPKLAENEENEGTNYIYTAMQHLADHDPQILISGYTKDNYKIQITIPAMLKGSLVTEEEQSEHVPHYDVGVKPIFVDEGKYSVQIKVIEKPWRKPNQTRYTTNNKDLLVAPHYSDILNGINPLSSSSSFLSDFVEDRGNLDAYKNAMCFLRKCSQDTYRVVPNLLRDTGLGYLYPTFHIKRVAYSRFIGHQYNVGFVFIHRDALPKIRAAFESVISNPQHFMHDKKIVWW